jgi:hypothetical protein
MELGSNNIPEVIQAFKRLGKAGRKVKRRAMSTAGKYVVGEMKTTVKAVPFKKTTGATMRSIGIQRMKDDSLRIGVRYNYKDKKTNKIPNKYAGEINETYNWFDPVILKNQAKLASMVGTLILQEAKAEFTKGK